MSIVKLLRTPIWKNIYERLLLRNVVLMVIDIVEFNDLKETTLYKFIKHNLLIYLIFIKNLLPRTMRALYSYLQKCMIGLHKIFKNGIISG